MYFIYSFVTLVAFLIASPYFVYQALRYKKYVGSLRQRLGYLPITLNVDGDESIWIHAVSVGEALTARALIADLKTRYPRLRLYLSTTTIAGQQVARKNLQHVDGVFYFPFDWSFIVRRTLGIVKPRLFVMMETEIWPNLLRLCRERGVKTVVINGRISSRSYPRYKLIDRSSGRCWATWTGSACRATSRRAPITWARPADHGHRQRSSFMQGGAGGHGRPRDRCCASACRPASSSSPAAP